MAREYVPIFFDWLETTQDLTAEEKGNLIDAVVAYASGQAYEHLLTGGCRIAFRFLKGQVDRNAAISDVRAKSGSNKKEQSQTGKSGGNKTEQSQTNRNKPEQTETKFPKEEEKENENKNKNEEEAAADARTRADASNEGAVNADAADVDAADAGAANADAANADVADAEARLIQEEHNQILQAAENAGFPRNNTVRARLLDAYAAHGREKVLRAIDECATHSAASIAYLQAVLSGKPKPATGPGKPARTVIAISLSPPSSV